MTILFPFTDEHKMIQKMSEDNTLEKTPVIIVSTEGSKTRIDDLLSLGVRAYLRKPINPEDLRNIVEEVMGGKNE